MQPLSIIFVEGWQAGYDGSRYERNPHQACQKKRQVWWSGWINGAAEREAEVHRMPSDTNRLTIALFPIASVGEHSVA